MLGVERSQLAKAFGDMSLVEFDYESRVGTKLITEQNQESDSLFVNEDGALAVQTLNDHVLANGAKTIEDEIVRVCCKVTFWSPLQFMQKVAQKILDSVNEDWQRAQFAPSYFLPGGGTAEFLDHSTSVRRRPTIVEQSQFANFKRVD